MLYTIEVTDDDIAKGDHTACGCPVALAMHRAMRLPIGMAAAYGRTCRVRHNDKIVLPDVAVLFIANFDENNPVAPFAFELSVALEPLPAGEGE